MPELTFYATSAAIISGPGTSTTQANALGAPDAVNMTTSLTKSSTYTVIALGFNFSALVDGGAVSIVKYGIRAASNSTAGAEILNLRRADATAVATTNLDVAATSALTTYEFTSGTLLSVSELKAGARLDVSSRGDTVNFKNLLLDAGWLKVTYEPPAAATSRAKRWSGSAWVDAPVQRWSGSAFVPATVKRWDGVAWV